MKLFSGNINEIYYVCNVDFKDYNLKFWCLNKESCGKILRSRRKAAD